MTYTTEDTEKFKLGEKISLGIAAVSILAGIVAQSYLPNSTTPPSSHTKPVITQGYDIGRPNKPDSDVQGNPDIQSKSVPQTTIDTVVTEPVAEKKVEPVAAVVEEKKYQLSEIDVVPKGSAYTFRYDCHGNHPNAPYGTIYFSSMLTPTKKGTVYIHTRLPVREDYAITFIPQDYLSEPSKADVKKLDQLTKQQEAAQQEFDQKNAKFYLATEEFFRKSSYEIAGLRKIGCDENGLAYAERRTFWSRDLPDPSNYQPTIYRSYFSDNTGPDDSNDRKLDKKLDQTCLEKNIAAAKLTLAERETDQQIKTMGQNTRHYCKARDGQKSETGRSQWDDTRDLIIKSFPFAVETPTVAEAVAKILETGSEAHKAFCEPEQHEADLKTYLAATKLELDPMTVKAVNSSPTEIFRGHFWSKTQASTVNKDLGLIPECIKESGLKVSATVGY